MPSMSLKRKLKLFSNFVLAGRSREIYNMFWVYPLWWNKNWASFLLNKFLPKLGIDLFPPFLEIEPTTVCSMRCKVCVPEGTLVLAPSPKKIQEITRGDCVYGKSGIQKVDERLSREYDGKVIQINSEGILPILLTPNHRVLVSKREWQGRPRKDRRYDYSDNFEFIEAEKLNNDYALVFPKLHEFSEWKEKYPLSKELMQFLGLYLAEGCSITTERKLKGRSIGKNGVITLYFGKHEHELINTATNLINSSFGKKANISQNRTSVSVTFHSVEIATWLSQFGKSATEKKIPQFIMLLENKELLHSFITGFIQGDGYTHSRYIQLTTSSRGLALQMQKILSRLDIFARLYVNQREGESIIEGRKVHINNLYNLRITSPDFYRFLNKENTSKRKIRLYEEKKNHFLLPVRKILSSHFCGRVYNLETEDNTFEVNNVVVHNCEHTYWRESSKNMSFQQFKKIFDDFGKPKWLGLTGIGSSYLNPNYHKMIAYAKSKGTIIEVFDHFAHFKNEAQIRELINIGPDFQFVSIYGATKKTSDYICRGSDFNTIIQNVRTFARLKKQMRRHFPVLNFHFIITRQSKDEIFKFLDFVSSLNTEVGEVLITPLLHCFKEAAPYEVKIDDSYRNKVVRYAGKKGISINFNWSSRINKSSISCCKEHIMPFIFVDGTVTPCCGQNEANQREWQKKMSLGNALKQDFRKVWYSPRYNNMRKMIRANTCPKECALCPAYQINKHSII